MKQSGTNWCQYLSVKSTDRGPASSVITTEFKHLPAHYGLSSSLLLAASHRGGVWAPTQAPARCSLRAAASRLPAVCQLTSSRLTAVENRVVILWLWHSQRYSSWKWNASSAGAKQVSGDNAKWSENFVPLKEECLVPFIGPVMKPIVFLLCFCVYLQNMLLGAVFVADCTCRWEKTHQILNDDRLRTNRDSTQVWCLKCWKVESVFVIMVSDVCGS